MVLGSAGSFSLYWVLRALSLQKGKQDFHPVVAINVLKDKLKKML